MSQHLSDGQLEKFISRKMSPAELLDADDHLAGCSKCTQRMNAAQRTSLASLTDTLISSDELDHVTYEQMSGYVDDGLEDVDREIVELHTATCRRCASEIEDLGRLRQILSAEKEAVAERAHAGSSKPFFSRPIFVFAASAAVVVFLIAAFLWYRVTSITTSRDLDTVAAPPPTISDPPPPPVMNPDEGQRPAEKIVASLNDGRRRIELDQSGKLTGVVDPGLEEQYRRVLSGHTIDIPSDVTRLKGSSGVLMGEGGEGVPFRLIGPVGRVVGSTRPTLRWQPLAGAEKYKVGIYDENFNEIAASPELSSTSWTPPDLMRGRTYQWQVTAFRGREEVKSPARPAPEARFKVIEQQHYSEIEKARHSGSHLLLGVAYANAGLLDDAEREFQTLLKNNPDSELVKRLLFRVRSAK